MLTAFCFLLLSIPGCHSFYSVRSTRYPPLHKEIVRKEISPDASLLGLNSDWIPPFGISGNSATAANESMTVALKAGLDATRRRKRKGRRRRRLRDRLKHHIKGWNGHFNDFPEEHFCTKKPTCMFTTDRELEQADFADGTVALCKRGKYTLKEDIVFDPSPSFPPADSSKYDVRDGYFLGFFAAIAIEGWGIQLDCKGHSIKMSEDFYKRQRFFSIIELGSRPFVSGAGPPPHASPRMSPCRLRTAYKIRIKNCKLGRSSHHGIHGNNAEDVKIKNVEISDFEVAGIALNGGRKIKIVRTTVGPSKHEAFPAALSQAIFLDRMVNTFGRRDEETYVKPAIENTFVTLRGERLLGAEVFDKLHTDLNEFLDDGAGSLQSLLDIPTSGSAKPDGSAIYGILIHKTGPAVGSFGNHPLENALQDGSMVSGVEIKRVEVKDLEVTPQAWISLHRDGIQVQGPAGAVFRATELADEDGKYLGNSLADAQIAIAQVLKTSWNLWNQSRDDPHLQTVLQRLEQYYNASFVDDPIFSWAAWEEEQLDLEAYVLACQGDAMSHFNKGAIGIRLDYLSEPKLKDLRVKNIVNSGGPMEDADLCEAEDYMGNDVYGIKMTNCVHVNWKDRPSREFADGLQAGEGGGIYDINESTTLF